jgi:bifunctional non-homologous end joining protein LigD
MPKRVYEPCLPTVATKVPTGPEWLHELKPDGFRLLIHRDSDGVRLFTRRGYEWTHRFPRVIDQARRLRPRAFVIDAEAVFCGDDGVPDFEQLMSRRVDREVFAYGFDLLALDGEDLRPQPLEQRRTKLIKLLARSKDGIVLSEHMDGEFGQVMFKHACCMGLEGVVSKRRDRPYVAGRSTIWLKIKNPASAAARRVEEGSW